MENDNVDNNTIENGNIKTNNVDNTIENNNRGESNMKNSNYIINGILAVAIIILFILYLTGRNNATKHPEIAGIATDSTGFHLPIAYIRTDSLLLNYKFYNDLRDVMLRKAEDKQLEINKKTERFRKEVMDFQNKLQNNVYLTQERVTQDEKRLAGMQEDIEKFTAQVQREFEIEEASMQKQLHDTITTALREYNIPKKYEMIFSNVGTDNIFYANDIYDITAEVIEFLNDRYTPSFE